MDVHVIPGRDLDHDLVRTWTELQGTNAQLESPYFAPEFTQAVASVRGDVEVAVVEEAGRIVAFLPFQRRRGSLGVPVGGVLSDYQGLICAPEFACDPRELIRRSRLVAWDFDHLIVSQGCFAKFHQSRHSSPIMDLSKGFAAYESGCGALKRVRQMVRRIEREVGPLRFVARSVSTAEFQQTLVWKSRQYVRSGKADILVPGWPRALIERLRDAGAAGCAGVLSVLYAGERLVAGHFGLRSRSVWHYWLPAYDEAMARYSPGLILLMRMAEQAPSLGLRAIDLGAGTSAYKERFMTGSVAMATGSVELLSLLSLGRAARRRLKAFVASSPLAPPARRLVRRMRGEPPRDAPP